MSVELLNKVIYNIYEKFLYCYLYLNIQFDKYISKNKEEITYEIIDDKITEIKRPYNNNNINNNNIILTKIEDVLHIYFNNNDDDIIKQILVALINVTIRIDDKLIVNKLDISSFINTIYIHNKYEILDNKIWFIIFNNFIDKIKDCNVSLTPNSKLDMEFNIINMNGEFINDNKLNLNML